MGGRDAEVGGDVVDHFRDVGRHARGLGDDGSVDVQDAPAAVGEELRHLAQELAAVDSLETRVGVRKVPADVALASGTQQRVADRVQQHVGIAVAREALVVRDLDAPDHELAARDQLVDVEALPDPHCVLQSRTGSGPGA